MSTSFEQLVLDTAAINMLLQTVESLEQHVIAMLDSETISHHNAVIIESHYKILMDLLTEAYN